MCGCSANFKVGNPGEIGYSEFAPLNLLLNNDPYTLLDFAWCINPQKVKDAFKPYGLEIKSKDDIKTVAMAASNGNDQKAYNVNFMNVIKSIDFTQPEWQNASCQILLTK